MTGLERSAIGRVQEAISAEAIADLAYELVSIPSPTGEEGAASRYYAERLKRAGLTSRLQYVEPGRPNVLGELKGLGGGANLLLQGHIDTIPAIDCVSPQRDADAVWGRGAADMKGSLAAMAVAAEAVVRAGIRLKGDLILAACVGHEIPWPLHPTLGHGDGAKVLARAVRAGEVNADCCVITEGPTRMPWVVQGGIAPWRIRVTGGPGPVHTTLTTLDHNPMVWVSELILDLRDYCREVEGRGEHPLIGVAPRLELGLACGGDYFNRNPAEGMICGAIRWDPGWSAEQVENHLRDRLENTRQRLVAKYGDDSIRIELFFRTGKDAFDAREHPRTEWLIEKVRAAAEPVVGPLEAPWGSRAATDLDIFGRGGGIPTVAIGLGLSQERTAAGRNLGIAHSNDEGISKASLLAAARVFAGLIVEICEVDQ